MLRVEFTAYTVQAGLWFHRTTIPTTPAHLQISYKALYTLYVMIIIIIILSDAILFMECNVHNSRNPSNHYLLVGVWHVGNGSSCSFELMYQDQYL